MRSSKRAGTFTVTDLRASCLGQFRNRKALLGGSVDLQHWLRQVIERYGRSNDSQGRGYLLHFLELPELPTSSAVTARSPGRPGSGGEEQVDIIDHKKEGGHVVYVIQFRSSAGEEAKLVEKRYTDFETLRKDLKDKNRFPSKGKTSKLRGLSDAQIETRKVELQGWLQRALGTYREGANRGHLQDFLESDKGAETKSKANRDPESAVPEVSIKGYHGDNPVLYDVVVSDPLSRTAEPRTIPKRYQEFADLVRNSDPPT